MNISATSGHLREQQGGKYTERNNRSLSQPVVVILLDDVFEAFNMTLHKGTDPRRVF